MSTSATSGDPARTTGGPTGGEPSGPSPGTDPPARRAVRLLLFAAARQAAGTRQVELRAATVAEVLEEARSRFGREFSAVLDGSRVWVNGEPVVASHPLSDGDEVAVLPPVSGGR